MMVLQLNILVPVFKRIIRRVLHNNFRYFLGVVVMMICKVFFIDNINAAFINLPLYVDAGTNRLVECLYIIEVLQDGQY